MTEENKTQDAGSSDSQTQKAAGDKQRQKQIRIIIAAGGGGIALVFIVMLWLARTPSLAISNPTPAKLTPDGCVSYLEAPDLRKNLRYIAEKGTMQKYAASKAPAKFVALIYQYRDGALKKAFGGKLTPSRLFNLLKNDFAFSTFEETIGGKRISNFLIITKLGFSERIGMNLGKRKFGPPRRMNKFSVYEIKRKTMSLYFTLAGGYLIAGSSPKVIEEALALGMDMKKNSVANHKLFRDDVKLAADEKIFMEWFSPGGNLKSSLTNAKINHAVVTLGGGGINFRLATLAHSPEDKSPITDTNPARFLPRTCSVYAVNHRFRRIWEDLLLGKAMKPDEAQTFFHDLFKFGIDDLGRYFEGNVALAMDGVFRAADRTPVPNFIFVYKVKNREKALDKVQKILRASIKSDFKSAPKTREKIAYTAFIDQYNDNAVLSPSYTLIGDYIFFALTEKEIQRVIDTAAGKTPSLASSAFFKKNYSAQDAKKDLYLLIQGPQLAEHAADYFTWFGDISSRELSNALNQVVIPTVGLLKYSDVGVGTFSYQGKMLRGQIRFHNSGAGEKKK